MSGAKIQQGGQAFALGGLAFEDAIAHPQIIQIFLEAYVFGASVLQADVPVPRAADLGKRPGAGAFDRRESLCRPVANEADIVLALDLEGEQQYLRKNQGGEQAQRTMARNDRVRHVLRITERKFVLR